MNDDRIIPELGKCTVLTLSSVNDKIEAYEIKDIITQTETSDIYNVCKNKKCDYIGKVLFKEDYNEDETKIQNILSKFNLAPSIKQIYKCEELY
jgi:hypothetical protein